MQIFHHEADIGSNLNVDVLFHPFVDMSYFVSDDEIFITQKPEEIPPYINIFFPMHPYTWAAMAVSVIVTTLCFIVIAKFNSFDQVIFLANSTLPPQIIKLL